METPPEQAPDGSRRDYPVVLSLAGRPCLVVGGGPVAARKARGLVAAGARVTLVAPRVIDAIVAMEALGVTKAGEGAGGPPASPSATFGSLEIQHRAYRSGEASRYHLVVTATGVPEIDAAVVSDAVSARVPVNGADGDVPGTIRLPAVHREGAVTVAVSTGGASPALARWLRDRIAAALPPETATLARLLEEARLVIQEAGRPLESIDWQVVIDERVLPLVEAGRIHEARTLLLGLGSEGDRPVG